MDLYDSCRAPEGAVVHLAAGKGPREPAVEDKTQRTTSLHVWLGTFETESDLQDYVAEADGDGDETSRSAFARDQGEMDHGRLEYFFDSEPNFDRLLGERFSRATDRSRLGILRA